MFKYDKNLFSIQRVRSSETQGAVKLLYAGEVLEIFGDDFDLNSKGQWESRHHDDVFLRHGPKFLACKLETLVRQIRKEV